MKKTLMACALLATSCTGRGETPITPSEPPTSAPFNPEVAHSPPTTETPVESPPVITEEVQPATTVTTWPEPICPGLPHPQHHSPCPVVTTTVRTGAKDRPAPAAISNTPSSSSSQLASIRACESHSNYATDTGNGYYGAYQFSWSTWASVGGSGNPAHASPAEQDMRAQMMIDAGRRGEWPNC